MRPIFAYDSYREYLKDYYREKKKLNPLYSFRFFARKAQLKSGNYLKVVMDGGRSLTHKTVHKFNKGLGLNEREALYFENLVFYNQATDESEKAFYLKNMEMAKSQDARALLSKDQYEVLSHWHPLAIKELALLPDFEFSARWIASRFDHKITPQQAKEAIDLLERVGLVEVDRKAGRLRPTNQSMESPDVDTSAPIGLFHKAVLKHAVTAIDEQKIDERCLSALTVAVRKKDLPEAFRRIQKFLKEMDAYFMKGKSYDSVYQLAVQLFRLDSDA
jgi:uncharacterized protein (TIGR02147 family)